MDIGRCVYLKMTCFFSRISDGELPFIHISHYILFMNKDGNILIIR